MNAIKEMLVPRLVAVQPTFLHRPDQEEVLNKILSEGFKRRRDHSLSETVWRALATEEAVKAGHTVDQKELYEAGKVLKEIVTGVWNFLPREWAADWQEITGEALIVHTFAGSGNLLEGGYVVLRRADGTHVLEHTYGPEGRGEEYARPWDLFLVHQMDVPDDVYAELDWADETDPDRLAAGRDADPTARAEEIAIVGDTHGWDNIDSYPLHLTGHELRLRWEDESWEGEIAENARNLVSADNYDIEAVPATLYEILTLCDLVGEDFDTYVAQARELRRKTLDADPRKDHNTHFAATLLRTQLNESRTSVLMPDRMTLILRGKDNETSRLVFDPTDKTWKAKPFE